MKKILIILGCLLSVYSYGSLKDYTPKKKIKLSKADMRIYDTETKKKVLVTKEFLKEKGIENLDILSIPNENNLLLIPLPDKKSIMWKDRWKNAQAAYIYNVIQYQNKLIKIKELEGKLKKEVDIDKQNSIKKEIAEEKRNIPDFEMCINNSKKLLLGEGLK